MSSVEYINSAVLTSTQSSVTFSTIPSNYTDLIINAVVGTVGGAQNMKIIFNSNSGPYYYTYLSATGTAGPYSGRYENQSQIFLDNYSYPNTTIETIYEINIFSYSNSNVYKSLLCYSANPDRAITQVAGTFINSNTISSINLSLGGSETFKSGSTFTLWGIK